MKYTFVIPTLNRAECLKLPVESILNAKESDNVQIIISNNKSDDDTQAVVKRFRDSRIMYVETPSRMSMSRNWEFASKFIGSEESIVCYLGDDDILSPNALEIVRQLFENYNIDAVSRESGYYFTPDCPTRYAGWLMLPPINGNITQENSILSLRKVANGYLHYGNLPTLYHGFVRSQLIRRAIRKGSLFNKACPDIYSDIALAAMNIDYIRISYPLTLGVASPKSNGLNSDLNNSLGQEFMRSSQNDFFHRYYLGSVQLHVVDCLEDVLDRHPCDIKVNYARFYALALAELRARQLNEAMESLVNISGKQVARIFLEFCTARALVLSKAIVKKLLLSVGLFGLALKLKSPSREGFGYRGDLRKSHDIDNPLDCLKLIEANVSPKLKK